MQLKRIKLGTEFEKYIEKHQLKISLSDFTTVEKSYNHSLRFELGDERKNGTKKRVKQAKERALKIAKSCFENDNELYVLTYEWNAENDFLARTPTFLYETLNVKKSEKKQKLALMYFQHEEPEFVDGYLGIYKLSKDKINWKDLIEGIANMDMGFNPSIHQIVFVFGLSTGKLFWMYDDRGCLTMSQNILDIKNQFDSFKHWLCEGYEDDYNEKIKALNNV